jgi:release factor glutamine methyltransferase
MSNQNDTCINDLLREGRNLLAIDKIENSGLESELLLGHVLKKSRIEIVLNKNNIVNKNDADKYRELLKRKSQHEPTAYIIGEKEFFGRPFSVNRSVLIPRPETEELVEWIIQDNNSIDYFLDICCGSGCIGITTACEVNVNNLFLSDVSSGAIETAKINSKLVTKNIHFEFILSNLYENIFFENFDLIAINPPYVTSEEYEYLEKNVKNFEPREALVPDSLGVFNISLAKGTYKHLKKNGWVYMETSPTLISSWPEIFKQSGFSHIEIKRDLSGKNRFIKAKK